MELSLPVPRFYRVKKGQTLGDIARAFRIPPTLLAACCGADCATEGAVLALPQGRGNLYVVRGGESETLLCGSPARFAEMNGTRYLYPGQTVWV